MARFVLTSLKRLTLFIAVSACANFFITNSAYAQATGQNQTIQNMSLEFTDFSTQPGLFAERCEGQLLIKSGQLEDIQDLRFTMPKATLRSLENDTLLLDKSIEFQQTRVMVLPIMGMVHLIGELSIDGVKTMADFQLTYTINDDQSISFKGSKLIKSFELKALNYDSIDVSKIKDDLKLEVDFKLNNNMKFMLANNDVYVNK